jgi:hypothetical protein
MPHRICTPMNTTVAATATATVTEAEARQARVILPKNGSKNTSEWTVDKTRSRVHVALAAAVQHPLITLIHSIHSSINDIGAHASASTSHPAYHHSTTSSIAAVEIPYSNHRVHTSQVLAAEFIPLEYLHGTIASIISSIYGHMKTSDDNWSLTAVWRTGTCPANHRGPLEDSTGGDMRRYAATTCN